MAPREFKLNELEVVGYASTLSAEFVPRIVPSIFRWKKQPDIVLMPPYRLEGDKLLEDWDGRQEDFERAVRRGQATGLASPIAAAPLHHLWIDENFEPHYEPASLVEQNLRQFAHHRVNEAQEALAENRLDEALKLTQTAISADDRCLNAILIKACVYTLRHEPGKVRILARIAETIAPGTDLFSWVELFARLVRKSSRSMPTEESAWPGAGGYVPVEASQDWRLSTVDTLIANHQMLAAMHLPLEQETALSILAGAN